MRYFWIFIFIFLICAQSSAQIEVRVETDQTIYYQGDTIDITVMAINLSPDTITLYFTSPCQANYSIDHHWQVVCVMVMLPNYKKIPPDSMVSWHFSYPTILKCNTIDTLSAGTHAIGGRVNGYGEDEIIINILPYHLTSIKIENLVYDFFLGNNYPSPFKEVTWIPVNIASPCNVNIEIFNSAGQYLYSFTKNFFTSGEHLIEIELNDAPCGIYWCRLSTGNRIKTIKLLLSK